MTDNLVDVGTGSTRSAQKHTGHHMIPTSGIEAIADRFALGAHRHGVDNWKLGQPFGVMFDHALQHMLALRDRIRRGERFDPMLHDDDVGAIGWFASACAYFEREAPEEIRNVFYEIK